VFDSGYKKMYEDKLIGEKNSKNNLVIANAQDAIINAQGDLVSVTINESSSQGPTDDRRIKPDITGNGTGLISTSNTGIQDYAQATGTSMSAPNVTGSLILLQEYYNDLYNSFMRSSTLKGIALHTADDAGRPGPDEV
jgi:subtilisin family serine protease